MILAGDIGGTKTLLGVFDSAPARPRPVAVRSFGTLDYRRSADDDRASSCDGDDARQRAARSNAPASASPAR